MIISDRTILFEPDFGIRNNSPYIKIPSRLPVTKLDEQVCPFFSTSDMVTQNILPDTGHVFDAY
jgi:hypothetical protein